jgi:hypothetical protein
MGFVADFPNTCYGEDQYLSADAHFFICYGCRLLKIVSLTSSLFLVETWASDCVGGEFL